ncbi:hypothetical protein Emag_007240 [Eimeria magna]
MLLSFSSSINGSSSSSSSSTSASCCCCCYLGLPPVELQQDVPLSPLRALRPSEGLLLLLLACVCAALPRY